MITLKVALAVRGNELLFSVLEQSDELRNVGFICEIALERDRNLRMLSYEFPDLSISELYGGAVLIRGANTDYDDVVISTMYENAEIAHDIADTIVQLVRSVGGDIVRLFQEEEYG